MVPAEDFDFAGNLRRFAKAAVEQSAAYNKDDFFDNLAAEQSRRPGGDRRGAGVDVETFGTVAQAANSAAQAVDPNRIENRGGRGNQPGRGYGQGPQTWNQGGTGGGRGGGNRGGQGGGTGHRGGRGEGGAAGGAPRGGSGGEVRRAPPAPRAQPVVTR